MPGRAPALDDDPGPVGAGSSDAARLPDDDGFADGPDRSLDAGLPEHGHIAPEDRLDEAPLTGGHHAPESDRPGDGVRLDDVDALDGSDGPDAQPEDDRPAEDAASFRELRPPRRLRLWQLAPIVGLAAVGSLMFAFPLAFEFGGDGGAVFAMLGLLLCCCAAGGGMMAARRVGHTWPGLPPRGSGRRADWRVVAVYAAVVLVLAALAIWRVARLR
ncbi:hypothetical protein [Streptomyces sp. Ru73]|uniref:hypothetical protein n=1 Tax=Streptomyces sp. Ru73 TaxID=2080748 RepID=UPI0021565537|nr:hypothetical protein [Streptomyces sp. Ru73]